MIHADFRYLVYPTKNRLYFIRVSLFTQDLILVKHNDKKLKTQKIKRVGLMRLINRKKNFILSYSNLLSFCVFYIIHKAVLSTRGYSVNSYLAFPSISNPVLITQKEMLDQSNINVIANVIYSLTPKNKKKYMISNTFLTSNLYNKSYPLIIRFIFILFSKRILVCKKT